MEQDDKTGALYDPSDFSIWAKVHADKLSSFLSWASKEYGIPVLEAHKIFHESIKNGDIVQIYSGYGWDDIPELLRNMPDFVVKGTELVSASEAEPCDLANYCEIHHVYYRGRECPVCSGDIIHHGHRS